MYRYLFASVSLCFLMASCSDGSVVVKYDNGNIKELYQVDKDSLKTGQYLLFSESGDTLEKAHYSMGKLNGIRTIYSKGSVLEIEEQYVDGVMDGDYKVYHPNGQLMLAQNYSGGELIGESLRYYENGQLEERVTFENGQENGPFTEYHENGQVHWEGTYLNGDNEFGLLKEYNDAGELIKKMRCDSLAICRTIWTIEDGDIDPNAS